MVSLQYKGRIHRAKFSARTLRYIFTDQAARLFPALQKRWSFPVEAQPIADAATGDLAIPSVSVEAPLPDRLSKLGIRYPSPRQIVHHVYSLEHVDVTGWAGAMMKDGLLLTVRPNHNWVSGLRAHPHRKRVLPEDNVYFNLMAPIPARGHIFHWLFDSLLPLLSLLDAAPGKVTGVLVNARRSEIQDLTLAYIADRFGIRTVEAIGQWDAVHVPHLLASVPVPYSTRALQAQAGLDRLDDLGQFFSARAKPNTASRRIYISRNDARLRRVLDEEALMPVLERFGIERVTLKGLPLADQAQLFREADAVIAPHGAGLAHLVWCKPGTKVVEFFPDPSGARGRVKNATSDYWLISQMRRLDYHVHLAGPVVNRADGFRISAPAFATALEQARLPQK